MTLSERLTETKSFIQQEGGMAGSLEQEAERLRGREISREECKDRKGRGEIL